MSGSCWPGNLLIIFPGLLIMEKNPPARAHNNWPLQSCTFTHNIVWVTHNSGLGNHVKTVFFVNVEGFYEVTHNKTM